MSKAIIKPSKCFGEIQVPPSKSLAHRAIIAASLANGESVISNIDYSNDILATIECMKKLGAEITTLEDKVIVKGIKGFNSLKDNHIHCKESGSTLRFLIPIFSLTSQKITFTGENRLLKRPQKIYEDLFIKDGLYYYQDEDKIEIQGCIKSGNYQILGNVSSQFITGLLFSLPLLKEDSTIQIIPPLESKSYIDLTIDMLSNFGIEISWTNELNLFIKGNQKYQPTNITVEGDFSQLAFFAVLAAINNKLTIKGVNPNSKQGDKQIIDILKQFNANVEYLDDGYTIYPSELKASEIDLKNCPDLGPILTILAMFSQSDTRIYHTSRLRLKESDRVEAMRHECEKMDCMIDVYPDEMIIHPKQAKPKENLFGFKDHRIVMALSVASTKLGGTIEGVEAINKSYPNFFKDLKKIGIEVEVYD